MSSCEVFVGRSDMLHCKGSRPSANRKCSLLLQCGCRYSTAVDILDVLPVKTRPPSRKNKQAQNNRLTVVRIIHSL